MPRFKKSKNSKDNCTVDLIPTHPRVTGSRTHLVIRRLNEWGKLCVEHGLVDFGLIQEPDYLKLNKLNFDMSKFKFLILTHSHEDHCGLICTLKKRGFSGKIYCTPETEALIRASLPDSANIQEEIARREKRKPLYTQKDIKPTLEMIEAIDFGETREILPGVEITFFMNGHLLGAALTLLRIVNPGKCDWEKDINILFTGDYKPDNMLFEVDSLPQWVYEIENLTVFCESTYGNISKAEIEKEESFRDHIIKGILAGNTIFVPVFSKGRSAEVLYELKLLQEEGILRNVDIFIDGTLTRKCLGIYEKNPIVRDFFPENTAYVTPEMRPQIVSEMGKRPMIILSSSGMGSHGPAQTYLTNGVGNRNVRIVFPGYLTPGTLGRAIRDAEHGQLVQFNGCQMVKKAKVHYSRELSSHAKCDELIDFLRRFKHFACILVNHGELSKQESFKFLVDKEIHPKSSFVCGRTMDDVENNIYTVYRMNPFGCAKTFQENYKFYWGASR